VTAGETKFISGGSPEKLPPVQMTRFEKPPVIDGKLDDEVWQSAVVLGNFKQTNPGDNTAPSKPTLALLGYDSKFLYMGFHCFDDPDKVRASVAKRDNVLNEDNVRVYLDTFNDARRAYIFAWNPLGVQQDGIYTEGEGTDFSVDIVMESKGVITPDGWTLEVAIPFKSLRYQAGKGKLWGFHLWRNIDRFNDEIDSWMPNDRSKSGLLSQEAHLTGLEGISAERTLELIPSVTVSETGKRLPFFRAGSPQALAGIPDPGRFVSAPVKSDIGLTAKYSLTPTITLDFAYNPDFAQIEADQTVVTANQRFPIFFDEKRPFFLEGKEIFSTMNTVVHTRAIVDPDLALKLTGKLGRNTFGFLVASDNAPGDLTEDERNDPASVTCHRHSQNESVQECVNRFLDKNAVIGVLRLKHDVGAESSIGLIATTYNFIDRHNHLGGIDGRFRLDKQTVLNFEAEASNSREFFFNPAKDQFSGSNQDRNEFRTGNGFAYAFHYDVEKRNWQYNYDARGRTRDFRADVGFASRTNTNRQGFFIYWQTEPKPKAKLVNWSINSNPYITFDWQGRSQEAGVGVETNFRFQRQSNVGFGLTTDYGRLIEEEFGPKRTARQLGAFYGPSSERSNVARGIYSFGSTVLNKKFSAHYFVNFQRGAFDLDFGAGNKFPRVSPVGRLDPNAPYDPGPGNSLNVNLNLNFQPTNALHASLGYTKSRLIRWDTGLTAFDDNITSLQSTYQFTRFIFARARIDYTTLSSNIRGQFLFGWTPNPGTAIYAGYNDDLNRNGYSPFTGQFEQGFRRNGRTFFLKMSWLFRHPL